MKIGPSEREKQKSKAARKNRGKVRVGEAHVQIHDVVRRHDGAKQINPNWWATKQNIFRSLAHQLVPTDLFIAHFERAVKCIHRDIHEECHEKLA